MEGLPASWWIKTGALRPSLHVLEDRISPDLRADLDIAAPCMPEDLLKWFGTVIERLGASDALRHLPLNPDIANNFTHPDEAPLEILICSRQTMEDLLDMPDAPRRSISCRSRMATPSRRSQPMRRFSGWRSSGIAMSSSR